jgi:hypothetical protein
MPTHKHYTQYNDTHETQCVVQRVVKGVVKIGHRHTYTIRNITTILYADTQCAVQRVVKGVVKIGHRHYTQYNDYSICRHTNTIRNITTHMKHSVWYRE